jgi:hypothetical protein
MTKVFFKIWSSTGIMIPFLHLKMHTIWNRQANVDVAMKKICDHLVSCQMSFSSPLFTTIHLFFSFPPRSFLLRVSVSWFCIPNIFPINWLIVIVNNIYFILSILYLSIHSPDLWSANTVSHFFRPLTTGTIFPTGDGADNQLLAPWPSRVSPSIFLGGLPHVWCSKHHFLSILTMSIHVLNKFYPV